MLFSLPGTRNPAPLPGESCSCKCRHPSATKQICFIPVFQEPANIPCIIVGLSSDLFLSSGPQAHPFACVWQLQQSLALLAVPGDSAEPCRGRSGRVRGGEAVAARVCFTMAPCTSKLPLTGMPSAPLAKEGCDN